MIWDARPKLTCSVETCPVCGKPPVFLDDIMHGVVEVRCMSRNYRMVEIPYMTFISVPADEVIDLAARRWNEAVHIHQMD